MPHSLVDIQSTVASKENKTMKQSFKKNIPQRFQSLFFEFILNNLLKLLRDTFESLND